MFFGKRKGKPFKMVWEVERNGKCSVLAGTAHFFPHSFRDSLAAYLEQAETVLFEGPLDKASMDRVLKAGFETESSFHLFQLLDKQTVSNIRRALLPPNRSADSLPFMDLRGFKGLDPVYEMVKGMRLWMAFFTIWTQYLERKGWKHSVDLEAYRLGIEMQKFIVFLETIDEQIQVLQGLAQDRIISFLKRADHWQDYLKEYVRYYLQGDLDRLLSLSTGFPSRAFPVIERRDEIFFKRLMPHLEKGNVIAFVGAPHVRGLCKMLGAEGWKIRH